MHERIEEREQPEHAPESAQPVPTRQSPQRCYRERDHDEAQRPIAKMIENRLDRICAEAARYFQSVTDKQKSWDQADQEDDRFPDKPNLLQRIQG